MAANPSSKSLKRTISFEQHESSDTCKIFEYDSTWLETVINEPALNSEIRQIQHLATTITGNNRIIWLMRAINFIDLTSLNGNDTTFVIERLCKKAAKPVNNITFTWKHPIRTAAVCVYPSKVRSVIQAFENLKEKDMQEANFIKVASVAAGFPSGQYPLETRLQEVRCAIAYGAQEIDIAIDRSLAMEHNWKQLYEELVAIRKVCDEKENIRLKTILSAGELCNPLNIYKAAMVAMMAGTDFIKTSTGKDTVNATLSAGIVMCRAIMEFQRHTGKKIGFKPAGGIKTTEQVLQWITLVKEELGNHWLINTRFRIGASSVLDEIVKEVEAYKTPEGMSEELSSQSENSCPHCEDSSCEECSRSSEDTH